MAFSFGKRKKGSNGKRKGSKKGGLRHRISRIGGRLSQHAHSAKRFALRHKYKVGAGTLGALMAYRHKDKMAGLGGRLGGLFNRAPAAARNAVETAAPDLSPAKQDQAAKVVTQVLEQAAAAKAFGRRRRRSRRGSRRGRRSRRGSRRGRRSRRGSRRGRRSRRGSRRGRRSRRGSKRRGSKRRGSKRRGGRRRKSRKAKKEEEEE